jgi:hypothetical protein
VPELESLIDAGLSEPNLAKRLEINAKALQMAMDTQLFAVIGMVPKMAVLGPRVDIDLPVGVQWIHGYLDIVKHRTQ